MHDDENDGNYSNYKGRNEDEHIPKSDSCYHKQDEDEE